MLPEVNLYLRFEKNVWVRSILRLDIMIVYGSMYGNNMMQLPSYASETDPVAMILSLFEGRLGRPTIWSNEMENLWENLNG